MEKTCDGDGDDDDGDDDDDDHIPLFISADVLSQILVWLPVISLLRFKSVCKSWRYLIESSFFIHLHLVATTLPSSSKFGTFIFQTLQPHFTYGYESIDETETETFMLSSSGSGGGCGCGGGGGGEGEEVFEMEDLGFPPLYKVVRSWMHKILMVGSCNGLVCLYDSKHRDVSLWNPATRQFRILPKPSNLDEGIGAEDFVAFGFDVKTMDYNVVRFTNSRPYIFSSDNEQKYIFRAQVYSLSTDSWRLLEGINSLPANPAVREGLYMDHGLYLNGSYFFEGHYLCEEDCFHSRHFSFDLTEEIFTTMQLPDEYLNPISILTCFGEKLALFSTVESSSRSGSHQPPCDYDIWVLNEHHEGSSSSSSSSVNKESSWTRLQHSIRIKEIKEITWSRIIPRGISNNGKFTFIETSESGQYGAKGSKLQLFNLVTEEAKTNFPTGKGVVRADVYKPSLVSVNGGGCSSSSSSSSSCSSCSSCGGSLSSSLSSSSG